MEYDASEKVPEDRQKATETALSFHEWSNIANYEHGHLHLIQLKQTCKWIVASGLAWQ